MTDPFGPAPGMPGPPGGQPPTPPPGWTPPPTGGINRPSPRWPWLVGAGVLVVLALVVGFVLLSGPSEASDARSVQDVADLAVEAAEDLDVEKGIDLLCEAPSEGDREDLEDLIAEAQEKADTDDPDVDYDVSDVKGGATGSFLVEITSDEDGLDGRDLELRVNVGQDGDRSCIEDAENP